MPLAYLGSIKSTKLSWSQVWLASPKKCVIEIQNIELEKAVVLTFFCIPVFWTKFTYSVSSVWSPDLIENLTIWPSDFQNSAAPSQLAS